MTILRLRDATAKVGEKLWKYEISLSRKIERREIGVVTVITSTPPDQLSEVMDEIWEDASNLDALDPDRHDCSFCEDDHKEKILSTSEHHERCPMTLEMKFGAARKNPQ